MLNMKILHINISLHLNTTELAWVMHIPSRVIIGVQAKKFWGGRH